MTFLDLAKARYSVRSYTDQPVEEETLRAVLEAGRIAPTGCNHQPQRILVVRSPQGRALLDQAANLYGAPVVLVVCADRTKTNRLEYDEKGIANFDVSIVTDHMMLQAAALGLGSCWICSFSIPLVRQAFSLPDHWDPVHLLALGYPAGPGSDPERHAHTRKPLSETVFFESVPETT